MPSRRRALLTFWVGVVLLLGAVLAPGSAPVEHRIAYSAERVDVDDPRTEPPWSERLGDLADCRFDLYDARCLWVREAGGNGTVSVNASGADLTTAEANLFDEYDYFLLRRGYARANATVEGRSLVVRVRPAPAEAVFRNASVPVDSAAPVVRRAVADGNGSTTELTWSYDWERPTDAEYVATDDAVYRLRITELSYHQPVPPRLYDLLRVVAFLGGLGLVYVGRGRHALAVASGTEPESDPEERSDEPP